MYQKGLLTNNFLLGKMNGNIVVSITTKETMDSGYHSSKYTKHLKMDSIRAF